MSNTRAPRTDRVVHWLELLGLALVLALAGFLRLGWPGVNSFGFDEARVSLLALEMAREGEISSVGIPSSAGVPNPPLFVWLMAFPFALSRDPLFATLCVAAFSSLAVVPLWSMARRAWGPWAALTAGLLYASAPYGVLYSRSIWSQDLMAPLAILWAWLGLRALNTRHGLALALHIALAGLAWQVHYSGAALIPVTAYLLVRFRLWRLSSRGTGWRWILAGGVLPVAAALPFTVTLLKSGTLITSVESLLARPAQWSLDAWRLWAEVAAGHAWEWLPLGWDWQWPPASAAIQTGARALTAALVAAGLLLLARDLCRARRTASTHIMLDRLIIPWAVAAPILFTRSSTPVYHQYLLTALPALALPGGRAASGSRRWQGPLVTALALAIALVQGGAVATSIHANASELHPGGMGTPLQYPRDMAHQMAASAPVYSHARNDDAAYDADAAAMSVLFWGRDLRLVNGETTLLLPPQEDLAQLLFLFPDSQALDVAHRFARIASETAFPRRSGEPAYTVLQVTGLNPEHLTPLDDQVLENGLALIGWSARRVGGTLHIITCWHVTEAHVPGRYHQFNHLHPAGADAPVAVQDAPLSSGAWAAGDSVLTWATFDVQTARSHYLDVGMYTFPELVRIPRKGGGDAIRLGPLP